MCQPNSGGVSQWKEERTKEAEARYGPAATWPRLSETLGGPKHPRFCQSCGSERPPEALDEATPATGDEPGAVPAKANDSFRRVKAELEPPPGVYGWQEHDGRDEPESIPSPSRSCSARPVASA